jgi:hypothetical protein
MQLPLATCSYSACYSHTIYIRPLPLYTSAVVRADTSPLPAPPPHIYIAAKSCSSSGTILLFVSDHKWSKAHSGLIVPSDVNITMQTRTQNDQQNGSGLVYFKALYETHY